MIRAQTPADKLRMILRRKNEEVRTRPADQSISSEVRAGGNEPAENQATAETSKETRVGNGQAPDSEEPKT
jgi:hypothetical protein